MNENICISLLMFLIIASYIWLSPMRIHTTIFIPFELDVVSKARFYLAFASLHDRVWIHNTAAV